MKYIKIILPILLLYIGITVNKEQKEQQLQDIKFKKDSINYNKPKPYFWIGKPKQYPRGDQKIIYLDKQDYDKIMLL